jgi:hypothetical protein
VEDEGVKSGRSMRRESLYHGEDDQSHEEMGSSGRRMRRESVYHHPELLVCQVRNPARTPYIVI